MITGDITSLGDNKFSSVITFVTFGKKFSNTKIVGRNDLIFALCKNNVFTEDFKLREFYKVPWKKCLDLIRRNKDRDVLMWDHLKEYSIEIDQLPKQEIVGLFKV